MGDPSQDQCMADLGGPPPEILGASTPTSSKQRSVQQPLLRASPRLTRRRPGLPTISSSTQLRHRHRLRPSREANVSEGVS